MEKGQSRSKANKGMQRFILGHTFAVLVAPVLLSMLVFNHLKKKKKSAEKESIEEASAPSFISPIPRGGDSNQYDVFLSFRGIDTRKEFTSHLYCNLVNAGTSPIYVFRDDKSLQIGEQFDRQLLDAITQSKISIPIISENYASSKWCLRELIHIMDCKKSMSQVVLPIFYKVDPADVRHLKGNFGKAFRSRKRYLDEKDIQEGPRVLKELSYLNGWESQKVANGYEGELVEKVVKTVLSKLRHNFQLDVTKHLVGVGNHVKKIMNWVNIPPSGAQMIGIYGMGGIGKTTLAKVIYNKLLNDFTHHSYIPDIRARAHHNGIASVQSQLIKVIRPKEYQVGTVDDGINLIRSIFRGKKVLILLDDIEDKDQLNDLARERDWFMAGSIIIVTTRNIATLVQSEFGVDHKYELTGLNEMDSLLLFNNHAFRNHPLRDFEDISHGIVSTTSGLPLAIEVIGSYLFGTKDRKVWQNMLDKLRNEPNRNVEKILKISYEALEEEHKEIFLDIACFFIGKESKFAIYMWEDCGLYASRGIEELKSRCLIKIGDDGKLSMHDQLRDLGRNIIRQIESIERPSRLRVYEEALGVLMEKKGTEMVEAICRDKCCDYPSLNCGPADHLHAYTSEQLKNFRSLRFLQLRRAALNEDFDKLFSEIRWLQWSGIEPNLSFLANNLHLSKLVVLQLSYNWITEHWKGWSSIMVVKQLKVLDLAFCEYLRCTPNLSSFTNLEILILKDCHSLEEVHHSIGMVEGLVSLDLRNCYTLKELPREMGKLQELKELILDGVGITEIPISIDSLRKLEKLSARACRSLREIPSSIWDIQNLQLLDVSESPIEKLPSVIGRLKIYDLSTFRGLNLILKDCYKLEQVHSSIGEVKRLVSMDLSGCGSLQELPGEVGDLVELKELILDSTGITKIPISIGYLRKLEKLSVQGCQSLRKIPSSLGDLQNLQHLDISESPIEKLPNAIGSLKKLRRLSLKSCYNLKGEIPTEIGDLSSLEILEITKAPISNLPKSIRDLSSLQHLSLWGCDMLHSLPELPSSIKYLRVSSHSPNLPQLSCLSHRGKLEFKWRRST